MVGHITAVTLVAGIIHVQRLLMSDLASIQGFVRSQLQHSRDY